MGVNSKWGLIVMGVNSITIPPIKATLVLASTVIVS